MHLFVEAFCLVIGANLELFEAKKHPPSTPEFCFSTPAITSRRAGCSRAKSRLTDYCSSSLQTALEEVRLWKADSGVQVRATWQVTGASAASFWSNHVQPQMIPNTGEAVPFQKPQITIGLLE